VLTEDQVRGCLAEEWDLPAAVLTRLDGGMGSRTWIVEDSSRRWVLKAVAPGLGGNLAGGLAVARRLDQKGIPAGAPEPTGTGDLTASVGSHRVGLLAWVPGEPLTGADEAERRLTGTTLGRVHRALAGEAVAATQRFHWVDPAAAHLSLRPWLRPAVAAAVAALERPGLRAWSTGLLHADPAPGAFRLDRVTGRCGVIDWSTALYGPLLYDLASAAMFLGGLDRSAEMTEAYLATGVLSRAETEEGLPLMLRLRWAVQADYFARRITGNDLTGIAGPEDNEKGLEEARRALAALCSPALLRLTPPSRAASAGGRSGRTTTRRRW
jgi:Ser/Thr protein kinase RdoA (MazF antagonist)